MAATSKHTTGKPRILLGMESDDEGLLPGWEAVWSVFGAIPNPGLAWPGTVGFSELPLDGARSIPSRVMIREQSFTRQTVFSRKGFIGFTSLFKRDEGFPIAYIMTLIVSGNQRQMPVAFGADWGTQWWLNGKSVYMSRGNFGEPHLKGEFFDLPLIKGNNVLVVKVIGGSGGWSIYLSRGMPRNNAGCKAGRSPGRPLRASGGLPGHGLMSRDYTETGLRIEERPGPVPPRLSRRRERAMASHGVQAHWIGIVDPEGNPYGPSRFLPAGSNTSRKNAGWLRQQVEEIHRNGMVAVTWFPGTHCRSAAIAHPEWKVVHAPQATPPAGEAGWNLCVHSSYGETLIRFVIESMKRYNLDGFWLDGTKGSHEGLVGCWCDECRRRFEASEGVPFPRRPDWNDARFRRWVAWRYRAFMDYWGRLSGRVRRELPRARIAINHLHRMNCSWVSAIPVDSYPADVIAGSEAGQNPFDIAFTARLQRAYGKSDTCIWAGLHRLFDRRQTWPASCDMLNTFRHHALCCMTAGAMPSFGTPDPGERLTRAYDALGALINPRRPFVGGAAEPYAALHLSQQAETFYFSRRRSDRPADWRYPHGYPAGYWNTLLGWHSLLCERQMLTDIVFDADLDPGRMFAYPVFIAPLSVSLSRGQIELFEEYAAQGGVLVVNRWFGARDRWGDSAGSKRLARLMGSACRPPPPEGDLENASPRVVVRAFGCGQVIVFSGNPGLRFFRNHSGTLSREIGGLIRRHAPPRIAIDAPRRLHVGLFRRSGQLVLHLQNFIAYSESERIPPPILTAPEPMENIRIRFRGYEFRTARLALRPGAPNLRLKRSGETVELSLKRIEWGEVIVMDG